MFCNPTQQWRHGLFRSHGIKGCSEGNGVSTASPYNFMNQKEQRNKSMSLLSLKLPSPKAINYGGFVSDCVRIRITLGMNIINQNLTLWQSALIPVLQKQHIILLLAERWAGALCSYQCPKNLKIPMAKRMYLGSGPGFLISQLTSCQDLAVLPSGVSTQISSKAASIRPEERAVHAEV